MLLRRLPLGKDLLPRMLVWSSSSTAPSCSKDDKEYGNGYGLAWSITSRIRYRPSRAARSEVKIKVSFFADFQCCMGTSRMLQTLVGFVANPRTRWGSAADLASIL
jgi:hypothetical protein